MAETLVSWVANLIEIGSVLFTVIALWRARRQLGHYIRQRQSVKTNRPWAWIIGLGSELEGAVKGYLADQGLEVPIESYLRTQLVTADDVYGIAKDLSKGKRKLTLAGATEVHLFYKGPVTMAIAIGMIVDNWIPVKVYEYAHGTYRLLAVLEKETIKGISLGNSMAVAEETLLSSPH